MKRGKLVFRRVRATEPVQLLPFYLPDNQINDIQIVSGVEPKGARFPVVSLRNGIFMGLMPEWVTFQQPTKLHFLRDEHGILMSSIPQELEQLNRQLRRAKGRVLVGGLGLGIAVALLEENPNVQDITVCEINRDIIDLISVFVPHQKTKILQGDLKDYLKSWRKLGTRFDFAYYDTWRGTGEYDLWSEVFPLRQASDRVINQDKIECWNEAEMIGQVLMGCQSLVTLMMQPNGKELIEQISNDGAKAFPARQAFIHYLAKEKPSFAEAQQQIGSYIRAIKHPRLFKMKWAKYNNKPET